MALSLSNPVFRAYAISGSVLVLKMLGMSWLTVWRMMQANGGFRAPEDLRQTILNPNPNPNQTKPNEYVDRVRRIHLNDLESIPAQLFAGLLFVATDPSPVLAHWLFYSYVAARFVHFYVYLNAFTHEVRATFWTIGAAITMYMAGAVINHVRKL